MMLRIKQFLAMAGLTALEAIRQPICLLLSAGCVVLIAAVPLMIMHTFGEDGKQVRDSALAFHFVFGLFIAGHASGTLLSHEMKSGTASAVLSKPVSRELFFLSKFTGITVVVMLFSMCAAIATLLSERVAEKFYFTNTLTGYITDTQTGAMLFGAPFVACLVAALINYRFKRPFASTAFVMLLFSLLFVLVMSGFFERNGTWMPYDFHVQWRIVPVSILITMALVVLAAIAIALSTRLDTVPTLVISSTVFLLGLMSDYIFGRFAENSGFSAFLYMVVPNWQHFWAADALSGGGNVPWEYVINAGLYAAAYSTGILCLGMFSFRHVEMK
ncbi:MAG: ABC transporter permease [Kiritimatiellae bacterium]|nr:ABC transporter permease [Kiritimatiellia bacterium]MDD5519339.1 ABC transporter permease [Kiritimatiellia bacterium]